MIGPLLLSLQVALVATALATLLGVPLGRLLARRAGWAADLASTALLLPMVLPPTVLGYALLTVLGRRSWPGQAWEAVFGAPFVFSPAAAVVAALLAALPFVARAAQAAFEQVDPRYEDAARTLGRGELAVFWTITLPLARRGVLAGIALGFARAVGEFGATALVAGNVPGRSLTASVAVYDAVQAGRFADATWLALALAGIAGVVLLLVHRLLAR